MGSEGPYHVFLVQAIGAALAAGQAIMRVYRSGFSVTMKDDRSPLTTADKESHDIIMGNLKPLGLPVLSEEGKEVPYAERRKWELFWMVDPLDGTKEFINRNGEFTVNIALINQGTPVLGVIWVPVTATLYFGMEGLGAFKKDGPRDPLLRPKDYISTASPLPSQDLPHVFTVVASRSHMNSTTETYIAGLRQTHHEMTFISRGSSLKFCLVAEGQAHEYPRLAPTFEWDTAAGQAIVVQAGGTVLLPDLKTPLQYNKESLRNDGFIAINVKSRI
jgi:3'(2'), 5'-bisphosphate nucleotidase